MVISQPAPGIILLHIIIVFHQRRSIALNASRDTYVLYMQLQHQVTHRNGAIKHIFINESDPRRDHQQIVLYSFCRSMRLLFI